MTNLFEALKGLKYYVLGLIYCLLSYWLGRTLLPTLGTIAGWDLTSNQDLIWAAIILTWIFALIILPAAKIVMAISEKDETNKVLGISGGIAFFLIAIAFTITGWFMITGLSSIIEDTYLNAIFWIGTITTWTLLTIVVPFMKITKGTTHD